MSSSNLETEGVIQQVDAVNRELHVHVNGACMTFDVPPGCVILLHQEVVKLRLLQPEDRVKVIYHTGPGRRNIASRVEAGIRRAPPL